jgi:hypothetical protein
MPHEINYFWLKAGVDWQRAALGLAFQTRQSQIQAFAAWQAMFSDIQRDMWDCWIGRFGGGVPIDG